MKILISACLIGLNTRYDGKTKINKNILKKYKNDILIPFCPEQFGGLKTPRLPATLLYNANKIMKCKCGIINKNGKDVSEYFIKGALTTIELVKKIKPNLIILKENSPSCGLKQTNINWQRKRGCGLTTHLLKEKTKIKLLSY